ncbi:hypothetical protein M2451_002285 [Dysgonomonas sp. PFB1-18]|uniref:DUF3836 domain-containing protein n=1 Tax=unclassified Dysgonomonas TaxID=2630389 RepID=UPI0024739B53|nr:MULTISPECIES: DUF3836 domain-containing protein [unclassified Dysgonomonas]MDH6309913.1 hypothetical protein [Dysgonomonas sp. PF1-14]MDH6339457.1 hypothetical protein [Dysgonomonas sp. PF1-16]MDH6380957.1 hypothetical protein [Dysgonomonas sp. PFB1-18]MDH6397966.1 hypothetical protein [Dysgonomonas sp. PF1-23]
MKSIIISVLMASLLIVNAYASDPVKVLSNTTATESGSVKEVISFEEDNSTPLHKALYYFDVAGDLKMKVVYKWNDRGGWVSAKKYEYDYNTLGGASFTYTLWDKKTRTWSDRSEHFYPVYDNNGKALAMKSFKVNNTRTNLMAQTK